MKSMATVEADSKGLAASAVSNRGRAQGSLAGWLLERIGGGFRAGWGRAPRRTPRLTLLERITLAPRQSLALVEADGRHLLVATSPDGAPTFYALDAVGPLSSGVRPEGRRRRAARPLGGAAGGRVSW